MIEQHAPLVNWRPGRILTAVRKGGLPGHPGSGFALGSTPGELHTPGQTVWHLRLSPSAGIWEDAGYFSTGIELSSSANRAFGLVVAGGVIAGRCTGGVAIALEAPGVEQQDDGRIARSTVAGLSLFLLCIPDDQGTRWALAATRDGPEQAQMLARTAAGLALDELWQEAATTRSARMTRFEQQGEWQPVLVEACETLAAALREPEGSIHGTWIDSGDHEAEFEVGCSCLLLPALARMAPDEALQLAGTILKLQEPDGLLAGIIAPDRSTGRRIVPPPLVVRSVLSASQAAGDLGFAARAVPPLVRWIRAQTRHYRTGQSLCTPRHPSEAVFPLLYDDDLALPDLPSLLVAEIDALVELARPFPDLQDVAGTLQEERARLVQDLEQALRHPACGLSGRYPDGRQTRRRTAAALLALGVPGLDERLRTSLTASIEPGGPLLSDEGVREFEAWADDSEPPPVQASTQLLVLAALERGGSAQADALARRMREACLRRRLPHERPRDRLAEASLIILLTPLRAHEDAQVQWAGGAVDILDRNRRALAFAAAGLAAALAVYLGFRLLDTTPAPPGAEEAALAATNYKEGDYAAAIARYQALQASPERDVLRIDAHLGNAHFRAHDPAAAERAYRTAIARQPDQPQVWLNLALALHEQGRRDEARTAYEDFLRHFEPHYPALAARARAAIALIDEQLGGPAPVSR